jgi:hypothetical protein
MRPLTNMELEMLIIFGKFVVEQELVTRLLLILLNLYAWNLDDTHICNTKIIFQSDLYMVYHFRIY